MYLCRDSRLLKSSAKLFYLKKNCIDKWKRVIYMLINNGNLIFITLFWGKLEKWRFLYYFTFV